MQKRLSYKKSFLKVYQGLGEARREAVDAAVTSWAVYLKTGRAPAGLGVKRLAERSWEFRVGIHTRILYIDTETEIVLVLIGNHDDIRKYLKRH